MTSRLLSTMILACLLVVQSAPAPADDLVPPGRNGASPLAPVDLAERRLACAATQPNSRNDARLPIAGVLALVRATAKE
jgi:hypothetical protein